MCRFLRLFVLMLRTSLDQSRRVTAFGSIDIFFAWCISLFGSFYHFLFRLEITMEKTDNAILTAHKI